MRFQKEVRTGRLKLRKKYRAFNRAGIKAHKTYNQNRRNQTFPKMSMEFLPPNPKEFFMAIVILAGRALFGT